MSSYYGEFMTYASGVCRDLNIGFIVEFDGFGGHCTCGNDVDGAHICVRMKNKCNDVQSFIQSIRTFHHELRHFYQHVACENNDTMGMFTDELLDLISISFLARESANKDWLYSRYHDFFPFEIDADKYAVFKTYEYFRKKHPEIDVSVIKDCMMSFVPNRRYRTNWSIHSTGAINASDEDFSNNREYWKKKLWQSLEDMCDVNTYEQSYDDILAFTVSSRGYPVYPRSIAERILCECEQNSVDIESFEPYFHLLAIPHFVRDNCDNTLFSVFKFLATYVLYKRPKYRGRYMTNLVQSLDYESFGDRFNEAVDHWSECWHEMSEMSGIK